MGSYNEIIKWLKSENVTTKQEARERLAPYVKGLMYETIMTKGASLAGTANGLPKVLAAFSGE